MITTILNNTAAAVPVRELYASVPASSSVVTSNLRGPDLALMTDLQAKVKAGTLTVSVVYSADELASGLLAAPKSILPDAISPVVDTNTDSSPLQASETFTIRRKFTAAVTGAADDVTIFAVGAVPAALGPKFRVLDAFMLVSATAGATTMTLNNKAALAGDQLAVLDAGSTGLKRPTAMGAGDATKETTLGAAFGLFLRRSDRAVAGEIIITLRKEL